MKAGLEEVLQEKERELKLYQRFLNLRKYCEETLFPLVDLPISEHTATLKGVIEKLIPDPKDRTEEMFSGEIFTLLGTIYLHDLSLVREFDWPLNKEVLDDRRAGNKGVFINYEIARRLDIPDGAIEAINAISYAHVAKKVPMETEITDNDSKAIVRNMKAFEYLFNFAHLLVDLFFTDLSHKGLRRYHEHGFALRPNEAVIDIDSREGMISIQYNCKTPYETRVIEDVKRYVESMFSRFKEYFNGKLGFQYREIVWVITGSFYYERDVFRIPRLSPYWDFDGPPVQRWGEAAIVLERLFSAGSVVIAGDASIGKTTLLTSFVLPQLTNLYQNVYYCELWSHPTKELRDVIGKRHRVPRIDDLDITSLCKALLNEGPCFFIVDGLEKIVFMDQAEREKLVRFVEFLLNESRAYLLLCGEKETFFDWYSVFQGMNIASLYELKRSDKTGQMYGRAGQGAGAGDREAPGIETQNGGADIEGALKEALEGFLDEMDLPLIMSVFVDINGAAPRRYSVEDICYETGLPQERVAELVDMLKGADILGESEFRGSPYFSLTNRRLKRPLNRVLGLGGHEEKKRLRNLISNFIINETFLDEKTLGMVEKWQDRMAFSKEETGIILGSLIHHGKDYHGIFEKAKGDGRGIDIQPILKLLYSKNDQRRKNAISILVDIRDKDMINPLLLHLREENVLEIKDLVIQGIGLTGKKRAIIAIMNTLKEIGDSALRLRAIEFFHSLFGENARQLLTEIKEIEEDPGIQKRIDQLLRT